MVELNRACNDAAVDEASLLRVVESCVALHQQQQKHQQLMGGPISKRFCDNVQELLRVSLTRGFDVVASLVMLGAEVNHHTSRTVAHAVPQQQQQQQQQHHHHQQQPPAMVVHSDSPLHVAVKHRNERATQSLLHLRADVNLPGERNQTALTHCLGIDHAEYQQVESAEMAEQQRQADNRMIAVMLSSGQPVKMIDSVLRVAAKSLRVDAIRALLHLGASCDSVGRDGRSALHLCLTTPCTAPAFESQRVACVEILAQASQSLNRACMSKMREYDGRTPLSMACAFNVPQHSSPHQIYRPSLASIDTSGKDGSGSGNNRDASSSSNNNSSLVRVLLAAAADPNLADRSGHPALCIASRFGNYDAVVHLINAKANVNAATPASRTTPLHFAIENDHPDIALLLLANNANPNVRRDVTNQTALDCAPTEPKLGSQCTCEPSPYAQA